MHPSKKTSALYSFRKTYNVNKTRHPKPGKGADICGLYYKSFAIIIYS